MAILLLFRHRRYFRSQATRFSFVSRDCTFKWTRFQIDCTNDSKRKQRMRPAFWENS
jgi:hypothetical protein